MRISFLCEGDAESPHGSFSGSAHSVLSEMRRAGHTVTTVDLELQGADRWAAAAASFSPSRPRWGTKFRLGAAGFRHRSRRAAMQLRRRMRDADIVFQIGATFEPLDAAAPYVLYCDSNIRMAQHGIATGQSEAVWLRPAEIEAIARREASVYARAGAIFTLSERLRRSFIDDFGIPPHRVTAVHAGPNFDISRISPAAAPEPDQPPTVLFVGKQFERKGGDLLLDAFAIVRRRIPGARLLVVGPESIPTAPGVECLGFLRKDHPSEWARLLAAYRVANVFCLPTRFEPFGIVYLEAMFFGLPCVGPDAWAVPEMVADGETGFLFPAGDVAALADRLERLLLDPSLASRLGASGRRRAARDFTWSAVVERMMSRMEPLASRRALAAV